MSSSTSPSPTSPSLPKMMEEGSGDRKLGMSILGVWVALATWPLLACTPRATPSSRRAPPAAARTVAFTHGSPGWTDPRIGCLPKGPTLKLRGTLRPQPGPRSGQPAGKRFRGTRLVLTKGQALVVDYLATAEHRRLAGKTVIAHGRYCEKQGQAISGRHFHIDRLTVLAGRSTPPPLPPSSSPLSPPSSSSQPPHSSRPAVQLDSDKDGIPDAKDECPHEPEVINGYKDKDGCPDKGPISFGCGAGRPEILEKIYFLKGSAKVRKVSLTVLKVVAAALKPSAHRRINRVEVAGHADDFGTAAANRQLSLRRARAVSAALIRLGVDKRLLKTRAYGKSRPRTKVRSRQRHMGRMKNRRVEFKVLK